VPSSPSTPHGRDGQSPQVSALTANVLARLPAAERQRAALRLRQRRERLAGAVAATLLLAACLGAQASDVATRTLAWVYAAAVAWKGLVEAALGGLAVLPVVSACCLLGIAVVLWQGVLSVGPRSLR
jgi:hypothetical protein